MHGSKLAWLYGEIQNPVKYKKAVTLLGTSTHSPSSLAPEEVLAGTIVLQIVIGFEFPKCIGFSGPRGRESRSWRVSFLRGSAGPLGRGRGVAGTYCPFLGDGVHSLVRGSPLGSSAHCSTLWKAQARNLKDTPTTHRISTPQLHLSRPYLSRKFSEHS